MKNNKNNDIKKKEKKNNKKVLIVSIIVFVVLFIAVITYILTGNKKLECTQEINQTQMKMTAKANISFSMYKADKVDAEFNIELDDKYIAYKDTFIEEFKKQYSTYEKQYNIKPKYETTDKGLKMSFSASNNSFQKVMAISSNKDSYSQIKKDMEKAGYTCK